MDGNRKKKQHYVPQCYLNAWAIKGTHQIHVYDKQIRKDRINNIIDVASENYFYDINFKKALSNNEKAILGIEDDELEDMSKEQSIENFFANSVEGELSKFLETLIKKVDSLTPKKIKRHFISKRKKVKFSRHLSFQHIRTKSTRVSIDGISDCLEQMLTEMNASKRVIDSIAATKDSTKLIHGQMILNKEEISHAACRFNELIWILAVNNTNTEFFTTDKPISTRPHIIDKYVPKTGLMSDGIEVFYPISPKIMLIMFDPVYHHNISKLDRHYFFINDSKDIDSYNILSSIFANRCIFSSSGDFTIIEQMLSLDNTLFDNPSVSLSWNGKVFYPRK